jgi:GNAT superfamily N-acetyltransferase
METLVVAFSAALKRDFFDLHAAPPGECFCFYWYLPEGEDWTRATAAQNRARREALLDKGQYDGYLAYLDGKVAAWCQVGPRDRLPNLRKRLVLGADSSVWSISCFFVLPPYRHKGVAARLLSHALSELKKKGVRRVEAYPRRGEALTDEDLWNGPERMLLKAGFVVVREDAQRPVLSKAL